MATQLTDQPTAAPTNKVAAVGIAGVLIAAIVSILTAFGVIIPDGLPEQANAAVAATVVVVSFVQAGVQFLAGYFKRNKVEDK